ASRTCPSAWRPRGRPATWGSTRWRSRASSGRKAFEPVAQVEEAGVDAVEGLPRAVVGALDGDPALRQRRAGHLHAAEPMARALLFLEHRHVDLAAEDLVDAAHEAVPGLLVVERVERRAVAGDAPRRMHQAIAERAAVTALVLYRWADWGRHSVSV